MAHATARLRMRMDAPNMTVQNPTTIGRALVSINDPTRFWSEVGTWSFLTSSTPARIGTGWGSVVASVGWSLGASEDGSVAEAEAVSSRRACRGAGGRAGAQEGVQGRRRACRGAGGRSRSKLDT